MLENIRLISVQVYLRAENILRFSFISFLTCITISFNGIYQLIVALNCKKPSREINGDIL